MKRRLVAILLLGLLALPALAVGQSELYILTSFPPSLFNPFIAQFEKDNPGVRVLVLNKNTNAALEEMLRGNERHFDIFWSSSVEAFFMLEQRELLQTMQDEAENVKSLPFALSSLGWAQRRNSTLPQPERWDDLLKPVYARHIAMARPSRSGTHHMFVERFLQVRGWSDGWAYLLALSGNLSTITSRSFGVIDGELNQRFEIGITLDFLARMEPANKVMRFQYGKPILILPAQIALLKGGKAGVTAQRFVDFVRSETGQRLLLEPGIRRIPYDVHLREQFADKLDDELNVVLRLPWQSYEAGLASSRYWAVNALFDAFITLPLPRRQQAWDRIRKLREQTVTVHDNSVLRQAEQLLKTLPVSEQEAGQSILNQDLVRVTSFQKPQAEQDKALERWKHLADQQLTEVEALLQSLDAPSAIPASP